jgi:glucose/arabinose dehydrogenase
MLRLPAPGGEGELYATGLRNTVAFDWRPGTDELYGVDNGRDWLGDDFPPCELNRIERGKFYGWPYANGNRVPDPDLGRGHADEIEASIAPVHAFGAHTAPLGIVFLRSPKWRAEYRDAALVALHGSWNRSRKQGYEVVSLHFHRDGTISERPFVTGFEKDEDVIGRPVDVIEGPDGAVYVSDDYAGAVYRISDRSSP